MENGNILKAIIELKAELKADISGLKVELKSDISGLRAEMIALEERLREYVHDTETRIVGEFFKYAQSMDGRMRTNEVVVLPMLDRMSALEARLLAVEKRLRLPNEQ